MAEIIGISKKQYCRLENDETDCKFDWIIRIIHFFDEDVREVFVRMLLLTEDDFQFTDASLYYFENDNKEIRDNLELYKNEIAQKTLYDEVFSEYLQYKLDNNLNGYKKFIKDKTLYFDMQKKYEVLPLLVPALSVEKVLYLIRRLTVKNINNVKNIDTTYIYTYINCIGELLKHFQKSSQNELSDHLDKLEEIILIKNHHFLLPIFYRHKAVYFEKSGRTKEYFENMNIALSLSEIFNQDDIKENIKLELAKNGQK